MWAYADTKTGNCAVPHHVLPHICARPQTIELALCQSSGAATSVAFVFFSGIRAFQFIDD